MNKKKHKIIKICNFFICIGNVGLLQKNYYTRRLPNHYPPYDDLSLLNKHVQTVESNHGHELPHLNHPKSEKPYLG